MTEELTIVMTAEDLTAAMTTEMTAEDLTAEMTEDVAMIRTKDLPDVIIHVKDQDSAPLMKA
jgi:hypothetical protein